MIETIDVNELYKDSSEVVYMNQDTINRMLLSRIIRLRNKYQFKSIKTNTKIVSRLADTANYVVHPINYSLIGGGGIKLYGSIVGIDVYLDSSMTWDDDRIIPIYDNLLLRNMKINKIRNKEYKFDMLEYLKIENLEI